MSAEPSAESGVHPLLERDLRALGLDETAPPDPGAWRQLLSRVSETCARVDADRAQAARAGQEQRAFYEGILGRLPVEVVVLDPGGRYLFCNRAAIRDDTIRAWIIGRSDREYVEHRGFDPEVAHRREAQFRAAVEGGRPVSWEETFPGSPGPRHHLRHFNPVFSPDGRLELVLGYGRDITERREAQEALERLNGELERRVEERTEELRRMGEQLQHDAFHDALTGLPNRALLRDRLGQAIERAHRRPGGQFAVLLLDCDRFKGVNDSLGHTAGDALLVELAGRLRGCVRPLDTVARMGGDEFVILLEEVDPAEALRAAERVQRALGTPLSLGGQDVQMSASIGVVLADPAHGGPEDVLRDADIAMYRAKARGRAGHQLFTAELRAEAQGLITLERDLRAAVREGQLTVEYQPIVALGSGEPEGFEALVRWSHPTLGPVSPAQFIPVAEESGLILDLDRWVLREASGRMEAWRREIPGPGPLSLSVNFSGQQFAQPDLCERVEEILRETGFDPRRLKIEMTESVLVQDSEVARANFDRLRALGIGLHIDDFGTGYSSLGYLQHHPVNVIKIDRSFITRMSSSPESAELVRTMIGMARHLGLRVVAEGIESAEQLGALRALGCDYGQGYLFSRPLGEGAAALFLQGVRGAATSHGVTP
ncbi:putative bifunctional diguanylate cyclase/phosphodiesterase [Deinococcus aestuarii]|uniref:putative bifunctional diguanylate cyclase/phosphodiesterase n=1 Tax=Deinococcus aestuarii TaxID=2774531 RepID=UPI001C0D9CA9|nr:EAL domain-containing protein [Deinococcus aestuarii]